MGKLIYSATEKPTIAVKGAIDAALEEYVKLYDVDLTITSGYRDPDLPKYKGFDKHSKHTEKGQARDISIKGMSKEEQYRLLKFMDSKGFRSLDETTRGRGPHLHFSTSKKPSLQIWDEKKETFIDHPVLKKEKKQKKQKKQPNVGSNKEKSLLEKGVDFAFPSAQASENNMKEITISEEMFDKIPEYTISEEQFDMLGADIPEAPPEPSPMPEQEDKGFDEFAWQEEFAYRDSPEFRAQAGEAYSRELEMAKAYGTHAGNALVMGAGDDMLAAVDTAREVTEEIGKQALKDGQAGVDLNFGEIAERYSNNLQGREQSFKDLREKYPDAADAGSISGFLVSNFMTGGSRSIFGAGKIGAAKVLGINAAEGALRGAGNSEGTILDENKSIEDTLNDIGWGAGMQGAGAGLGALAGKGLDVTIEGVKSFGRWAGNKLGANSYLAFMGAHNGKQRSSAINSLLETRRDVASHANRMTNYKIKRVNSDTGEIIEENLITPWRTPNQLKQLVDEESNILGEAMGAQLSQVNQKVDPFKIVNSIKKAAEKRKKIYGHTRHKKEIDKILLEEEGQFIKTIPKGKGFEKEALETDLIELDAIRRSYNKLNKDMNESNVSRGLYGHLAGNISEIIDDALLKSAGSPAVANYKKLKTHYGDMEEASKMLKAKIENSNKDNTALNVFQHYINRNTLAGFAIAKASQMDNTEAAVVGLALSKVATNSHVNAFGARAMLKVADAFKKTPQKYTKLAQTGIAASAVGPDAWEEWLAEAGAEVALTEQPLERSTKDVLRQKGAILTILDGIDKDLGSQMREAIESENPADIGNMMGVVEEYFPNMMLPGIGWDGIAVTDADKQTVQSWISERTSTKKRKQLSEQFQKDNKVPMEMITGEDVEEPDRIYVYRKIRDKLNKQPY